MMGPGTKKRFFSSHAKSSAAIVSLAIHAILIIVAFTFVAVTVITKADQSFEAKPVNRPRMQLKKLQVPVNVTKKKAQKPKLRKRIVVQPKLNQNVPDIKMPEITGVKGGIGSAGDGLGSATGLGFTMPEIEIFGVKGKGEKIFLILYAGAGMMYDEMGGIPAYTIIKQELVRIVEELPSTALFNVAVYEDWKATELAFPTLMPANEANAKRMKEWLMPLNSVSKNMAADDFGLKTIGKGGERNNEDMRIGVFANPEEVGGLGKYEHHRSWYPVAMIAQKQQADTIFLLTDGWGLHRVESSKRKSREEWDKTSPGKKWAEGFKEAQRLLDLDNKKRAAKGQPPKAIYRNREWEMMREYFPDYQFPPSPNFYHYTAREMAGAFVQTRDKYRPKSTQTKSGIKRKKSGKIDFSFNVIHFVPQGGEENHPERGGAAGNLKLKELPNFCRGDYQQISGLEEIESYVTGRDSSL